VKLCAIEQTALPYARPRLNSVALVQGGRTSSCFRTLLSFSLFSSRHRDIGPGLGVLLSSHEAAELPQSVSAGPFPCARARSASEPDRHPPRSPSLRLYHRSVALLNAPDTHQQALNALASEGAERSSETLRALLPYLSLSTLLSLRQTHADALGSAISERLYDLLDAQRDWVVSPGCPTELRDSYLVRLFGKEWDLVKGGMTQVAADKKAEIMKGLVLDSSKFTASAPQPQPCSDLATFKQKLKQATGGLLEKRKSPVPAAGDHSVSSLTW
jgi:hypothetical protein